MNTLETIGLILGIVTAIGGPMIALARAIFRLLKRVEQNCIDIMDSKEERKILLRGTLACLKGLEKLGCNGPVTTAIKEIEAHLIEKAHD
jgi:hypothetical protein